MITGYLIGDRQLVAKFQAAGPAMKLDLDKTVQKLGFALQLRVQRDYLRGPRPGRLGVVTSRLITSITQGAADSRSRFESTATTAYSYVGTNVSYGEMWENGFTRKIGAGARGGNFSGMSDAAKSRYFSKHPPGQKDMPPRAFLAPALEDMKPIIVAELEKSLNEAAKKAMS
jgi:hypothetical protein